MGRCKVFGAAIAGLREWENGMVVGQVVTGLRPFERRLMDSVVDDGFAMTEVKVEYLDEMGEFIECTTYIWREKFADALADEDWSCEEFCDEYLKDFEELCGDMRKSTEAEKLGDDDLKELALARRRRETGFDDEPPPVE